MTDDRGHSDVDSRAWQKLMQGLVERSDQIQEQFKEARTTYPELISALTWIAGFRSYQAATGASGSSGPFYDEIPGDIERFPPILECILRGQFPDCRIIRRPIDSGIDIEPPVIEVGRCWLSISRFRLALQALETLDPESMTFVSDTQVAVARINEHYQKMVEVGCICEYLEDRLKAAIADSELVPEEKWHKARRILDEMARHSCSGSTS